MPQFNLNQLRLKNFRAFTELTKINFGSRITLVFGKGSVGKSTIIDAINILSTSYKSQTNLLDKSNRFHLSQKRKLNEILLGFTVATAGAESPDSEKDEEVDYKGIDQFYIQNKDEDFYPHKVDLFSKTDDPKDEKFVSLLNTPIDEKYIKEVNKLEDFVSSSISFIENETSWSELYKYTFIHKEKLIKNLDSCRKFHLKRKLIEVKIREIQLLKNKKPKKLHDFTDKDKKNIDKLRKERKELFDESYEARGFNPAMFPFAGKSKIKNINLIDQHIKFLKSKPSYKKFIEYISGDIKFRKKYLYKNYKLYSDRDLFREVNFRRSRGYSQYGIVEELIDKLDMANNAFSEFLCISLTTICTNDFEFIDKELFKWSDEEQEKVLSADAMFRTCHHALTPVLDQIKVVRHQENLNNVMKTLNQFAPASSVSSNFHKIIDANAKEINRWYSEFGYDFAVSVDKIGPRGETEIMYKKDNFKIPADLGGSGAQHLLTFLTEVVSSKGNTILLEEPEKALHASMQIKLARLFTECSNDNQLIIETHSENLLYGLLKEIRDKNIFKEEIKIIYVYMENGESKIDELELNDKGGFKSKWRDGFFTEKLDIL